MSRVLLALAGLGTSVAAADPVNWTRDAEACKAGCPDVVKAVATALKVHDIVDQGVQAFAHDRDRMFLVSLTYGPAQDCPSGCFHDHADAIVRGSKVIGLKGSFLSSQGSGTYARELLVGALRAAGAPNVDASSDRERYEFYDSHGIPCANGIELSLQTDGDAVAWTFNIPKTQCDAVRGSKRDPTPYRIEIEGQIQLPINPNKFYKLVPDSSRATARVVP